MIIIKYCFTKSKISHLRFIKIADLHGAIPLKVYVCSEVGVETLNTLRHTRLL